MSDRELMKQALAAWDNPTGMKDLCVAMDAIRTALEQQAEASQWRDMVVVNLVREGVNKHKARELADHFAASPQRQWVGLTDEELDDLLDNYITAEGRARAIEAKLKEKNV